MPAGEKGSSYPTLVFTLSLMFVPVLAKAEKTHTGCRKSSSTDGGGCVVGGGCWGCGGVGGGGCWGGGGGGGVWCLGGNNHSFI